MVAVWWYGLRLVLAVFMSLTTSAIDRMAPNLFAPCRKLRKVRLGIWEEFRGTEVQKVLSSITSKHLSTVSLELAHPDWYITCHTWEEFYGWWRASCATSLTGVWRTTTRCWCWRLFGGG